MAEVDKTIEETVEETTSPNEEVVSVELEEQTDERSDAEKMRDAASLEASFYKNIAEDLDAVVLYNMCQQLFDDYKIDKV